MYINSKLLTIMLYNVRCRTSRKISIMNIYAENRFGKDGKRDLRDMFSINDRDEHTPYIKSLRVVSTITYSLKD